MEKIRYRLIRSYRRVFTTQVVFVFIFHLFLFFSFFIFSFFFKQITRPKKGMYSKMRYISDRQWECRLPLCSLVSGCPEGKRKKALAAASAGGSWRLSLSTGHLLSWLLQVLPDSCRADTAPVHPSNSQLHAHAAPALGSAHEGGVSSPGLPWARAFASSSPRSSSPRAC